MITAKLIAAKFIERATSLGYKGKARDNAALDFFCGAAAAQEIITGEKTTLAGALFIVSVRGWLAVVDLEKGAED